MCMSLIAVDLAALGNQMQNKIKPMQNRGGTNQVKYCKRVSQWNKIHLSRRKYPCTAHAELKEEVGCVPLENQ